MQLQIFTITENIKHIWKDFRNLDKYVFIGVFHFSAIYIVS